ncbi:DUF4157 domain-containing protein [Teredinibacter sp. KSP-S5-2]|uniref:eCIS core domain-containing protein n=1 Tax=Teredinibacter sp. KSP-S5-2 TaxID=3034506 RepID=UPI00293428CE|nr:DUF4157 domain-containing protein [Teredinibacter sp. KSP-S5-2]WNO11357.1 DUF4157 domain-containing protein [Teredinibacter sp. KSP-S5-2]
MKSARASQSVKKSEGQSSRNGKTVSASGYHRQGSNLGNRSLESLLKSRRDASSEMMSPNNARPFSRLSELLKSGCSGNSLSVGERQGMEVSLGLDLSAARLHQNDNVKPVLQQAGAHALSVGKHILLSPGLTGENKTRAINHELVHTAQANMASPNLASPIVLGSHRAEHEFQANNLSRLDNGKTSAFRLKSSSPNVARRQSPNETGSPPVSLPQPDPAQQFNPVNLIFKPGAPWLVIAEEGARHADVAYELYGVDISSIMEPKKMESVFGLRYFEGHYQYEIVQGLLKSKYLNQFQQKMGSMLDDDVRRAKSILLNTYIDSDEENTLMGIVRYWAKTKNWVAPDGNSYFDCFLSRLKNSSLHTSYLFGLHTRNSRSFLDELYDNIEDDTGELNTLIAQNSIKHGGYRPFWHQYREKQAGRSPAGDVNNALVNRSTNMILNRIEGYTSGADSTTVAEVLTGLPPREQSAVLRQIMSRHDEAKFSIPFTDIGLVGRFGEPTKQHMLYYLFENLDDGDKQRVAESLQKTGVMSADAIKHYKGGRSWAGQYLPMTTYWGSQATQFYADKAVQTDNPLWMVPGAFSALWTPETASQTILTLGTAGLGGALAQGPMWLQKTALVLGTGSAAYQGTLAITELITGRDAYTGKPLDQVEMITRGIMAVANAIFVVAGFYGARQLAGRPTTALARGNGTVNSEVGAGPRSGRPFAGDGVEVKILSSDGSGNVQFIARHTSGDIAIGRINMSTGNGSAVINGSRTVTISGGEVIPPRLALTAELGPQQSTALVRSPSQMALSGNQPIIDLAPLPGGGYGLPGRSPAGLLPAGSSTALTRPHLGSRIILPSLAPAPGQAPVYSLPLGNQGQGGVMLMNRGLQPNDFANNGFRGSTIADDPTQMRLWMAAERQLATSPRNNAYKRWLTAVRDGSVHSWSSEELGKVYSAMWDKYKVLARAEGIDVATIHHWNYNKSDFPLQVVDPRHLMPVYGQDLLRGGYHPVHQGGLHPLTTSGHPTNDPVAPIHVIPLENYNVPAPNLNYPGMPDWWHPPMAPPEQIMPFGWDPYYPPLGNWPPELMQLYPFLAPR